MVLGVSSAGICSSPGFYLLCLVPFGWTVPKSKQNAGISMAPLPWMRDAHTLVWVQWS